MPRPIALAPTPSDQKEKATRPKRLVIELGRHASADLSWLVEEQEVNKTTAVNRAIQVYRLLIETQKNGGSITLSDPVHGDTPLRIVA
jgi:hypothetical protein